MMTEEDSRILNEFATRVRRRFSGARILAFESRSRGKADWDSGMDVCVVLEHMERETDQWIRAIAWEVGFENERIITTVVFDKDQFENGQMSESTFVANILREGVTA